MTNTEFSNEFDILYNSITSNQAPGLDEYEKSVFLTKAQYEILREYFNSRTDSTNGGFDGNQKRQYDFSSIVNTTTLGELTNNINRIDKRSRSYKFPTDYFLSVNEIISDDIRQYSIITISYSDYQRLMLKPYAYPSKKCVWRMFTSVTNNSSGNSSGSILDVLKMVVPSEKTDTTQISTIPIAEIIGKFTGNLTYRLRYVKKPNPIILTNLDEGLSIDGVSIATPCSLPELLHKEILERAVTLARITYQIGSTETLSQTQSKDSKE